MTTPTMKDGEFFDAVGDMMSPSEIVRMLDRHCWPETLVGIYQILHGRFREDVRAQELLKKDLSDIDPGYFELRVSGGEWDERLDGPPLEDVPF